MMAFELKARISSAHMHLPGRRDVRSAAEIEDPPALLCGMLQQLGKAVDHRCPMLAADRQSVQPRKPDHGHPVDAHIGTLMQSPKRVVGKILVEAMDVLTCEDAGPTLLHILRDHIEYLRGRDRRDLEAENPVRRGRSHHLVSSKAIAATPPSRRPR